MDLDMSKPVFDPERSRAKCVVCKKRINMNWDPFCCQVCSDSDDAASRRSWERSGGQQV